MVARQRGLSLDQCTASGRLAFAVCYAKAGITIRVGRVGALVLLHVTTAVQSSVQVEEVGIVVHLEVASAHGDCRRRDTPKGTSEGLEVGPIGTRSCSRGRGRTRLSEVGSSHRWGFSGRHRHRDCRSTFGSGVVSNGSGRGGSGLGRHVHTWVSGASYGL